MHAASNASPLVFFQLQKIDEAKRLVYGRAVQEVPDRVGEIFDYTSSKPLFQKWSASQSEASLGKSAGNIRAMHKDIAAGIIVPGGLIFHDDECAIDLCAKVTDDQEWEKVASGTYTGFSIGGRYAKKWEDPELKKTRYTGEPSEISLVDRPCVGTATFFEVQKADGSTLRKDFSRPSTTGDAQSAATTAVANADKAMVKRVCDGRDLGEAPAESVAVNSEFEHEGRSYQVTKIEGGVAQADEVFVVKGSPDELGAFAKALTERAMTIADVTKLVAEQPAIVRITPETIGAKTRELYKAAGGTDEDPTKLAQFRIEAEKELKKVAERKDANPDEGKKKYGAVKFADEKNKKYPLDTKEHVKAALSYFGMPKNRAKYSAEDQKAIDAKIKAAAKEMGIDEESKKALTAADLRKGLRACGQFAFLIDALCDLAEAVEFESAQEGDESPLPARLYNSIADLGSCLQDMVAEEIKEEVEGDEPPRQVVESAPAIMALGERIAGLRKRLDAIVGVTPEAVVAKASELCKAAGKDPEAPVEKKDLNGKPMLLKAWSEFYKQAETELRKAGARNSAADLKRIQAVHDHSVSLGATCENAEALDDETNRGGTGTNKAEPTAALTKIEGENADLRKSLTAMEERLKKIEAQPQPIRGVIKVVAVSKGEEGGMTDAEQLAATVEPVRKQDGEIDPVATAMKMVLAKGGVRISTGNKLAK